MRPDGPRDPVVGPDDGPAAPFPLRLDGKVIKGFGRGSKELGIPTANIPISGLTVGGHSDLESGVYYGWAGLSAPPPLPSSTPSPSQATPPDSDPDTARPGGRVYPMVMSIGWNPFYKNSVRSVEVHILHDFSEDFYGSHMNLSILGFIRPEYDYVSKDGLIEDIKTDIDVTRRCLEREGYWKLRNDPALVSFEGKDEIAS